MYTNFTKIEIGRDGKEKWILRKAFEGDFYLPEDVLWRQKEQFTDGVGYSWLDNLKEYCANSMMKNLKIKSKMCSRQTNV